MISFKQFVLLENNNLVFDLVNAQQFYDYVKKNIVEAQFRNNQEAPGSSPNNYKSLFIDALSKLFAKEIILGMNKFLTFDDELEDNYRMYELHADEGSLGGNFEDSQYANIQDDSLLTPLFQDLILGNVFANIRDELNVEKGRRRYLNSIVTSISPFAATTETDPDTKETLNNFLKSNLKDWMFDEKQKIKDNLWYFFPNQMPNRSSKGALLIEAFDGMVLDKDRTLLRDIVNSEEVNQMLEFTDFQSPTMIRDFIGLLDSFRHFMDFVQSRRLNPENAAKSGVKYAKSQTDVMKYFLKSPTTKQIARMLRDFDKKFLPYVNNINIKANLDELSNTVYQWQDGISIIQPIDEKLCQLIGKEMGHCVGDYDPTDPDSLILQILDNRKMVGTIQLTPYKGVIPGNINQINNSDIQLYEVGQLKGKFNKPVDGKYSGHLKEFFLKYDIKNSTKPNFQPLMLTLDQNQAPVAIKYPSSLSHI